MRAFLALASLGAVRRGGPAGADLARAVWALAAIGFALFGHAAAAAPRWLAAPAVALHAALSLFRIVHARMDHVELELADAALYSQGQPVVRSARIMDAVEVDPSGLDQPA